MFLQSDLVSWLAEEMSHQGLDVDQLDIAANSPLHLAAKHGATTAASVLLHHGAQISLKVKPLLHSFFKITWLIGQVCNESSNICLPIKHR